MGRKHGMKRGNSAGPFWVIRWASAAAINGPKRQQGKMHLHPA